MLTLGEGVPVKQSEGELEWVVKELTVAVPQKVPVTLLHSDAVALPH